MGAPSEDSAIKVVVRCRPLLPFEAGNASVINIIREKQIKIQPPQLTSLDPDRYTFTFDAAYGSQSTQNDLYVKSVIPLVHSCIEGYNATILAYGQTGSGKTHSVLGQTEHVDMTVRPENDTSEAGVIPRALRSLFLQLEDLKNSSGDGSKYDYSVQVQFLELYGDDIRDLLHTNPETAPKLSIRDGKKGDEPEVINVKTVDVSSADEALVQLTRGMLRRVTRATAMNSESSRSHAIMTVLIQQTETTKISNPGAEDIEETSTKHSKFHFVDLAGSERAKRTGASGQGLKEGININRGLLILGNVISALASQAEGRRDAFVPYRDSKLTRLLRGSLGGNHKTLMVACVSPSGSNTEESLNTLRYANRAKNIQNKAVINIDSGSKMILELREQLKTMATEYLGVRAKFKKGVVLDGPGTVFTHEILVALSKGATVEINLNGENNNGEAVHSRKSSGNVEDTTAESSFISGSSRSSSNVNDSDELKKAKEEIKRLRKALEKSDDMVIETKRQLGWLEDELKMSKDEVMALAAIDKSDDSSSMSALTNDFDEMPRLNQETYETVKNIYEEKLIQMTFELKEREDERDNLAMTLYRHESDSQRLLYVKNTLSEDLAKKEQQIANMKKELRDMSKVTVIQNGAQQIQRQFSSRLSGFTRRPPKNSSTSPSMSSYYTEKLNKIERHIKLREEECANLGLELEKLEADSQIFTDLAKDLMARLNAKNQEIKKLLKSKTKEQLQSSGILGERDQLKSELERLKGDSDTFSALVKALTDERKTKLEHVEKYKKRHREMATSIGITSPYKASDVGGDDDDDNSVGSTWSLMSIDTVSTCASNVNSSLTMTKIDYDQKMSQLESNITKFEDERVFILTDLEKLEADTHAFMELSGALKQKLKAKEDQVEKAKKDLDDFTNKLQKQEMELQGLANKGKKATK
jgi:kinesin family protein 4/21/27